MDLVVIFLTDIGQHVIVPEKYVYDLNVSQLKNRGKNACIDFLVYYTDDCIECQYYPDPILDAIILKEFPAGRGGWFHGRTVFFTSTKQRLVHFFIMLFLCILFNMNMIYIILDDPDEAKEIKTGRRNKVPPVYNPARLREKPLPSLVLGTVDADDDHVDDDPSVASREDDPLNNSTDTNNDTSTSVSDLSIAEAMKPEPIFEEMNDRDANAVAVFLNDSYEKYGSDDDLFIHKSDYLPAPIVDKNCSYEVKKNDIVTGKKPFATDVSIHVPLK